ncbi:carbamoyl phosphate synthase small subunit [Geomicrobium sediminis]|uniref:Carbamoyl phosphate synthase small chain n=1 Tax=Geomicrobium sediminis TaxID=1347788 RepID=A0ABS2P981_9BACL|nr:carbamoyl phosphate synthase small subunit [Geomicrobium sediminis]MBM7631551.1 carbamoyl-phosphate synthase small subunit [Geomicrobium sediminis]
MKGYIVLENGEVFTGKIIGGNESGTYGEAVFFTGMTGYQEVATDPSYRGQIVIFTYPLIGNYGIQDYTSQSEEWQANALVIGECSEEGYHYLSKKSVMNEANNMNVPIIVDVDTRALVKCLREQGAMGAVITTDLDGIDWSNYQPVDEYPFVKEVSTKQIETYGAGETHIALYDFGHKRAMIQELTQLGAKVSVVPFDTPYETIQHLDVDGVLFSNGPGNPKQLEHELHIYRKVASAYPTFAICLGHQLLALAFGADTKKLKFGHRGANQPVLEIATQKVDMTAQNHGFVVDDETIGHSEMQVTHVNINDGSIEGLKHEELPLFTVQYHPEASPGPKDSHPLFHQFFASIEKKKEVTIHA